MKKRFVLLLIMFTAIIFLGGCSGSENAQIDNGVPQDDSELLGELESLPERKIIYSVDLSIYTKDLDESIQTLKASIESDEWFDYENIRERQASFRIRVKSDRLDEFIQSISDTYDVDFFSKTARDVSLDYQDTTNRIDSLQAQYDRLMVLYEDASLEEMITINTRLGEIETELLSLEGTLNEFDSLVDYSEVEVTIYQNQFSSRSPFFNRLGTGFMNGLRGLLLFFDGLLIVIATVLPFAIIFVPTGIGLYIVIKRRQLRKSNKDK